MRNLRGRKERKAVLVFLAFLLPLFFFAWTQLSARTRPKPASAKFNGERAFQDIRHQTQLGARTPGSEAHAQARAWIKDELQKAGWHIEEQIFDSLGHRGYNIVASRSASAPEIILGAHYDSRIHADHDPDVEKRKQAVLGANDGASGVAALLELARVIPANLPPTSPTIWLVFFDLEDNGNLPTWDWILGSRAFVDGYTLNHVQAAIILDMIGDADLNIYLERNSSPPLRTEIWDVAAKLGYDAYFIPQEKYSMLDDHTPFLEAGIPAVDIIDFDYPYWHTSEDTIDKVSANSLAVVGETALAWLETKK